MKQMGKRVLEIIEPSNECISFFQCILLGVYTDAHSGECRTCVDIDCDHPPWTSWVRQESRGQDNKGEGRGWSTSGQ